MHKPVMAIALGITAIVLVICVPATAATFIGADGDGQRTTGEPAPHTERFSTQVEVRVLPLPSGSPTPHPTRSQPDTPRSGTTTITDPSTGDLTDSSTGDLTGQETGISLERAVEYGSGDMPVTGRDTSGDRMTHRDDRTANDHRTPPTSGPEDVTSRHHECSPGSGDLPFTGIDAQALGIAVAGGLSAVLAGIILIRLTSRRRRPRN
jgi:hypothetical protein